MNFNLKVIGIMTAIFLGFSSQTYAGQEGQVVSEKANIYKLPDTDSSVLETLEKGTKIRLSNSNREGWYKIKTKNNHHGWIRHELITTDPDLNQIRKHEINLLGDIEDTSSHYSTPDFFITPSIFGIGIFSAAVGNTSLNYYTGYGYGIDFTYAWSYDFRISLKPSYYNSGTLGSDLFFLRREGLPVLLGIEFMLTRSTKYQHWIEVAGGFDYFAKWYIDSKDDAYGPPHTVAVNAKTSMFTFNYSLKRILTRSIRLKLSLGAFYTPKKSSSLEQNGFISQVPNGSNLISTFSGALLSLGIEFGL